MTDQKSSPAQECDHSRNGTIHGSNGSPHLPVQGQAIQQILAAAPSRDHPVRVLSPNSLSPHTHPRFHKLLPPHVHVPLPSISLGEHGSETLTYLSSQKPDCHPLPPRCLLFRLLSSHLGRAGRLAIQDGLHPNPRRSAAREAHANMSTLVRRPCVSFHFALSFLSSCCVHSSFPNGSGVCHSAGLICGFTDSRSITPISQLRYIRIGNKLA